MLVPMADAQVDGIGGWVVDVIGSIGELGVGLLIALENVVPPIPSEVILPFAGFSASQGRISLVGAWVAATVGSLVGAWILYGVGAFIAYERLHGLASKRWFLLFNTEDLHRGERFFDRHGSKVVLLARFVPLLRSIVSVPAGVVRMPLLRFTGLTALERGVPRRRLPARQRVGPRGGVARPCLDGRRRPPRGGVRGPRRPAGQAAHLSRPSPVRGAGRAAGGPGRRRRPGPAPGGPGR